MIDSSNPSNPPTSNPFRESNPQAVAGKRLTAILDWIYGPVYESLPEPMKKTSAWTEGASQREEVMYSLLRRLHVPASEYFPDKITRAHLLNAAYDRALNLTRRPGQFENHALTVLEDIPGVGEKALFSIHALFSQGVQEGFTPGYMILHRSEYMYTRGIELAKEHNKLMASFSPPIIRSKPPTRTMLKTFRSWWVENGGSE